MRVGLRPSRAIVTTTLILLASPLAASRAAPGDPAAPVTPAATDAGVRSPSAEGDKGFEIELDTTGAPDLRPWAERVKAMGEAWYPTLAAWLYGEGFETPRKVRLVIKEGDFVAYTAGGTVTCSAKWFRAHPEDRGAVIHELVHTLQRYRGQNPVWLTEGITDYFRWWYFEPPSRRPRLNPDRIRYTDAYQPTGGFLWWLETTQAPGLISELNQACRTRSYRPEIFKERTGKEIDALFQEFVAYLKAGGNARAAATWTNPKDGSEMVYVNAGPFWMGTDGAEGDALWQRLGWPASWKTACESERPRHRVSLPGYWIAKKEVTFAQYARFLKETGRAVPVPPEEWGKAFWVGTGYATGRDEQPVVGVTWADAKAYAEWAGCRLPTEAEWEKAARGDDARTFPWGEEWADDCANTAARLADKPLRTEDEWSAFFTAWGKQDAATRYRDTLKAVGSFPKGASPYGCLDMAGNAWEWTSSAYAPYPYSASDGREDPESAAPRAIRGGAVLGAPSSARAASRGKRSPWARGHDLGFRLAK